MITAACETKNEIEPQVLKTCNFFHFRDMIAIPRMNDLMFRRRLFNSSWHSRRQALLRIKAFLASGKQFNSTLTEAELSIQRDWVLLFGNREQLTSQLAAEAKFLPVNQHHKHHEKYAFISYLATTRIASDLGEAVEDRDLLEAFNHLARNTKEVTPTWAKFWLEDDDTQIGPVFYASNEESADKFALEVASAKQEMNVKHVGLQALGFLEKDSALNDPKNIEKEKLLVQEICVLLQSQKTREIERDVEDTTFSEWEVEFPTP